MTPRTPWPFLMGVGQSSVPLARHPFILFAEFGKHALFPPPLPPATTRRASRVCRGNRMLACEGAAPGDWFDPNSPSAHNISRFIPWFSPYLGCAVLVPATVCVKEWGRFCLNSACAYPKLTYPDPEGARGIAAKPGSRALLPRTRKARCQKIKRHTRCFHCAISWCSHI